MITSEKYQNRLEKMRSNIYIDGEKVDRTDERLRGGINVIKVTYDRAFDSKFEDLCTATSHITGEKINHFCHIHQTREDLLRKQQMTRQLAHLTGGLHTEMHGDRRHERSLRRHI